jgi:hypothetical protein
MILAALMLPDMRVLGQEDGFPDLDEVELTVFGLKRGQTALKTLQDRLKAPDPGRRNGRLRLVALD